MSPATFRQIFIVQDTARKGTIPIVNQQPLRQKKFSRWHGMPVPDSHTPSIMQQKVLFSRGINNVSAQNGGGRCQPE
jgi:hypothetical protein